MHIVSQWKIVSDILPPTTLCSIDTINLTAQPAVNIQQIIHRSCAQPNGSELAAHPLLPEVDKNTSPW